MARRGVQMTREGIIMAVQEFEDEAILVSTRPPLIDHLKKEFVLLVRFALFEEVFNCQRGRNLLFQHPSSIAKP